MIPLAEVICSSDAEQRNRDIASLVEGLRLDEMLEAAANLEDFRHRSANLYERVRACAMLYALHRFHIPFAANIASTGRIPFGGYEHVLNRRFEEAIAAFLQRQAEDGPSAALSSALAGAYHRLTFQTLADQVRRSVRSSVGNRWMFRVGHAADHPLRIRAEMLDRPHPLAPFPILRESTPVRMDLTHAGWSDIFLLAMDYPEGARVINVSVDLAVRGRDSRPRPPVEAYLRVIDEPVIRLASVDLGASARITEIAEVFDFARDYLGLLKAALIASGIVPPGLEGSEVPLRDVLASLLGPGLGLELVSCVNGIPKGSRLAVSTTLLAAMVAVCMRATSQIRSLTGPLAEADRRVVASRAILGEWLAGSGGGWQDSGGLWPGIKLIEGQPAAEGDPEYGISRGRLLPGHRLIGRDEVPDAARQALERSLVLVHGGMAQNVGPILEMVTEKYLLRCAAEWRARREAGLLLDHILECLRAGDVRAIGDATTRNYVGPIQTIIPWAGNHYTETLIRRTREFFGEAFWGFWMLGGMSGGGMGFMFAPSEKPRAQDALQQIMTNTKRSLEAALPFAMDPVIYDFAINDHGSVADMLRHDDALLPSGYYLMAIPAMVQSDTSPVSVGRRADAHAFARACRRLDDLKDAPRQVFERILPPMPATSARTESLAELLAANGFDEEEHEQIRSDMRRGRIGLAQNRLPVNTDIRDVEPDDVARLDEATLEDRERGREALERGEVAIVTLAAGAGSRWTQGAGVVKALHPFARIAGEYRTFLDVHMAKARRTARETGQPVTHVITTSNLTEGPIREFLKARGAGEHTHVSSGRSIGLRLIPMVHDLRFLWEEQPQQILDERAQRVRESLHAALIGWARSAGEGSDYTDNTPAQCVHPVGHWYEVPNMLKNGMLADLLERQPGLTTLMLHNIDTLGADLAPEAVGLHKRLGGALTFEVIPRWLEDRGGGLARVNGRVRLVEGLAMPREEQEFDLSYYNSMTTWIDIDALLGVFGLDRGSLRDPDRVSAAVRTAAARVPTYITIKDVKRRWGYAQEDVYPVAQFEKLWGDMTGLSDLDCRFIAVPRLRGQQLKDQAQLDGWMRDGSAAYVETLGDW
ncbi:MAG: UTP--glucose-1-phosphate uridylyltransferase [Chthonomonadales bacterium]|nr:UTP--glucose-1-phosphate uridylyltransferase [Chthonomonadales bacterium]